MSISRQYLQLLLFVITLLTISVARTKSENIISSKNLIKRSASSSEYPSMWAKVDFKPLVDNERLFQKYKECLTTDNTKGCPRIVMQVKELIPEIVETMCAKCSPALIKQIKAGVEYVCLTHRADYEQVAREKDPDAKVRNAFRAKYGHVNC